MHALNKNLQPCFLHFELWKAQKSVKKIKLFLPTSNYQLGEKMLDFTTAYSNLLILITDTLFLSHKENS